MARYDVIAIGGSLAGWMRYAHWFVYSLKVFRPQFWQSSIAGPPVRACSRIWSDRRLR